MQEPFSEIPLPIAFNPFKHLKNCIVKVVYNQLLAESEFNEFLSSIGNNYIDIYTGLYTPDDIYESIISQLKIKNIYDKDAFCSWVSIKEYQTLKLDDDSLWVLRKGESFERYIHIHPAKTGKHTMRFKASTLKTIYWLKHEAKCCNPPQLKEVNLARSKIGLSPVKQIKVGRGILKCWEKFNE